MRLWIDPRDGTTYRIYTMVRRSEAVIWWKTGFKRCRADDWARVEDLSEAQLINLVDRARGRRERRTDGP